MYVLDLMENAKRREIDRKFDFSVLLMYRAFEMIIQRLLIKYGMNPREPDFEYFSVLPHYFRNEYAP
ncbi:MAG: hypothetical protein ACTSSP_04420 [Candidatus Asgardarchaeia archaeon]